MGASPLGIVFGASPAGAAGAPVAGVAVAGAAEQLSHGAGVEHESHVEWCENMPRSRPRSWPLPQLLLPWWPQVVHGAGVAQTGAGAAHGAGVLHVLHEKRPVS